MKALTLAILTISAMAQADQVYSQFYVTPDGKKLETTDALMSAIKGQPVYSCQTVQAALAKSGKSISMKNVKKPKIEKQN